VTRVQADIVPAVRDWLATQNLGAAVRDNVPANWTPAAGPLLIIADDGGPARWPIKSKHTLRLTARASGRTVARRIVTLAAGKLVESRPRPAGVAHVDSDMGAVLDGRDKDTGAMLASVLITAHARMVEA
jgi:hypothetical protein